MHPMTLYHIVISSGQPHADLLLFMEAEQRFNGLLTAFEKMAIRSADA
jgi:hypothetical protein